MGGTLRAVGSIIAILLSVSPASSQVNIEKLRRDEDQRGLSGTAEIDLSGRSGNVNVWQVTIGGRVDFVGPAVTTLFVTRADFGWEDGERFSNEALLHLRRVHRNRSWLRPEAFVQINYDRPLLLTFRGLLGGGLRIGILSAENFRLWWGSAYMFEHESLDLPGGARHPERVWVHRWSNYLSSRAVLTERATLLWSAYLQPRINVVEDVRAINELDLGVELTSRFSLVVTLRTRYDSRPPDDTESLDTALSTGISVAF